MWHYCITALLHYCLLCGIVLTAVFYVALLHYCISALLHYVAVFLLHCFYSSILCKILHYCITALLLIIWQFVVVCPLVKYQL